MAVFVLLGELHYEESRRHMQPLEDGLRTAQGASGGGLGLHGILFTVLENERMCTRHSLHVLGAVRQRKINSCVSYQFWENRGKSSSAFEKSVDEVEGILEGICDGRAIRLHWSRLRIQPLAVARAAFRWHSQ